jgi:hypothetical protein
MGLVSGFRHCRATRARFPRRPSSGQERCDRSPALARWTCIVIVGRRHAVCPPPELKHCRMGCRKGLRKDNAGLSSERPCNSSRHASPRDELDLYWVGLDEPEGPLKLQSAVGVIDNFRALEPPATMNEGVDLDRSTLELTGSGLRGGFVWHVFAPIWLIAGDPTLPSRR